nr:MAG TPA: hypothetical protein [Caudoviricetes sp.]
MRAQRTRREAYPKTRVRARNRQKTTRKDKE